MPQIELIANTLLGVESLVADEVRKLGYETITVQDGRVTFGGDEEAICRANLWLRTAERLLVKMGEFTALTFDELFEGTKALPWEDWLPEDAQFPVKGYSLKSKLHSVPDCQSIIKKAVVERLKTKYKRQYFEETGPLYRIQFSIMKDHVTLMLDTSGNPLHKRGYRKNANEAPLRETLAASLVILSRWREGREFLDPFCGSGTIAIEAAMIGANIAPGLKREFAAEMWKRVPRKMWNQCREEAREEIRESEFILHASDIDDGALRIARENAALAGVGRHIVFEKRNMEDITERVSNNQLGQYGYLITNPPYGERLGEIREVERLYTRFGKAVSALDTWSFYVITSHEDFEKFFGRKANKKRKLYNGMLRCNYYQFYGPKPPKDAGL